jgi:hypothetical protein
MNKDHSELNGIQAYVQKIKIPKLKVKAICGSYSTYALKAYCILTQKSSFIHLQRRCTHQAA